MRLMEAPSCSSISLTRSCVIGRTDVWLCSFMRIAAASGCPIQMGRNLFPSAVFSRTIGCLPTRSKLTPYGRKPAVTRLRRVALGTRAHAVAQRPRAARGDLAERGDPADLPPDGGALAVGTHFELRCRGRARPGSRPGDE